MYHWAHTRYPSITSNSSIICYGCNSSRGQHPSLPRPQVRSTLGCWAAAEAIHIIMKELSQDWFFSQEKCFSNAWTMWDVSVGRIQSSTVIVHFSGKKSRGTKFQLNSFHDWIIVHTRSYIFADTPSAQWRLGSDTTVVRRNRRRSGDNSPHTYVWCIQFISILRYTHHQQGPKQNYVTL